MASLFDLLKSAVVGKKKPAFTPEMDREIQSPDFMIENWQASPPRGFNRLTLPTFDDVEARRMQLQQMQQMQQPGLQRARMM